MKQIIVVRKSEPKGKEEDGILERFIGDRHQPNPETTKILPSSLQL